MGHATRCAWLFARNAIFLLAVVTSPSWATNAAAAPTAPVQPLETQAGPRFKAVLIAGDRSSPAFDHATEAMRNRLFARQATAADIQRLSAAPAVFAQTGVRSSTLEHVLAAIERMHPGAGEGCLVFATSHGAYEEGLVLAPSDEFLTPAALDAALVKGCGNAPSVVIISGCFSGTFTKPPMTRANRIILTAARADRPSFGCGAGSRYTFYDRCLLGVIDIAATWRTAYDLIADCVSRRERSLRFHPSEPRAYFGEAVASMAIPRAAPRQR